MARFRAHRVNEQRGMMWRDDGMVLLLLWWWCGRLVGNARLGEGVWAKNAKPSCRSSVSGTLCETAARDDAEGWWGGRGDGGSRVARWAVQAGVVGLGCIVGNSGGGRWEEVVGW